MILSAVASSSCTSLCSAWGRVHHCFPFWTLSNAEQCTQAVNNSDSAAREEEEDPLAGVDVEAQLKIERAIERAAAAKRQKQQREADERVHTDPNEGGFVKHGPDPLEAAAALATPAIVADLSDADILADGLLEAGAGDEGAKRGSPAHSSHAAHGPIAIPPLKSPQAERPTAEAVLVKVEPDTSAAGIQVQQEEADVSIPDGTMEEVGDARPQDSPYVKLEKAAADLTPEHLSDAKADESARGVKQEGISDGKMEDPIAEKQLRQMGMFSSGRSNTKGVANALIEKRKSRQRKAGIGAGEDNGGAVDNPGDTSAAAQQTKVPALAQQNGKADSGVSLCPLHVMRICIADQ